MWGVKVGVVKHRFRIVAHGVAEMRPVFGDGITAWVRLDSSVLRQLQLDLDDDTERAVAADRAEEQLGVLVAARRDQRAVGEDELQAAHRKHERPEADVAAVAR